MSVRVYKRVYNNEQHIVLRNGREWRKIDGRDPDAITDWTPIEVSVPDVLDGEDVAFTDFPHAIDSVLVLRHRARELLDEHLAPFGMFLPLKDHDTGDDLWLYKPTTEIDVLDEENSDIQYTMDGSMVMKIVDYRLVDVPPDVMAFTVPQDIALLVSGEVVDLISESDLVGPRFELVWQG